MRHIVLIIFVFLFINVFHERVVAKTITFTVDKVSLRADDEMTVTASHSGFSSDEYIYIKGAFYKEGSSNYFGLTKQGESWIKNSASTVNQRKVLTGEWDGKLIIKSDPLDSGFQESGSYKFKVGFYTISSNGEPSSVRWSDTIIDVYLERPIPTNTPLPLPTLTPTPLPTLTPIPKPTEKPSPSPIPFLSPTIQKTISSSFSSSPKRSPTLSPSIEEEKGDDEQSILGTQEEKREVAPSITPSIKTQSSSRVTYKNAAIALSFIGVGTGILSVTLYGKKFLQRFSNPHESFP